VGARGAPIAGIARDRKTTAHRGGAETRRTANVPEKAKPLNYMPVWETSCKPILGIGTSGNRGIGESTPELNRVSPYFPGLTQGRVARARSRGESGKARKPLAKAISVGLQYPCPHPNVDKQAVSGVPELHWRKYEHHFRKRRAALRRSTDDPTKDYHHHNPREKAAA
jgi:hypothetical protein